MIPVGIIVLIHIVGIILTIALMTIPVSIAKLFCKSVGWVVALAMLISFLFCIAGLAVSYNIDIPSGACIIVIATVAYLVLLLSRNGVQRWLHRPHRHGG